MPQNSTLTRKRKKRESKPPPRKALRIQPKILIFDVDGVLVDVRATYWKSALETVRHLTGKRVTYAELHQWKSKPGFNDDWSMVAAWVTALGRIRKILLGQRRKTGKCSQRKNPGKPPPDREVGRAV